MSPDHFSRMFKKHTGKRINDYINELRIENTARMLLESEIKIIDAAFDSGFNNLSSFYKEFLKIKGVTPSRFRKGDSLLVCT